MAVGPLDAKPKDVEISVLPILVVPKAVTRNTTITNKMLASFHHIKTLLICVISLTP